MKVARPFQLAIWTVFDVESEFGHEKPPNLQENHKKSDLKHVEKKKITRSA